MAFNCNVNYSQSHVLSSKRTVLHMYVANLGYVYTINRDIFTDNVNSNHVLEGRKQRQPIVKRSYVCDHVYSVQADPIKLHIDKSIEKELLFTSAVKPSHVSTCLQEHDVINDERYYSTKTPYQCPLHVGSLSSPPAGYQPICVQLLARHGSRTLNHHSYDQDMIRLWHSAQASNMLTPFGQQLKHDIEVFVNANHQIG
jgi:hypothetical protein